MLPRPPMMPEEPGRAATSASGVDRLAYATTWPHRPSDSTQRSTTAGSEVVSACECKSTCGVCCEEGSAGAGRGRSATCCCDCCGGGENIALSSPAHIRTGAAVSALRDALPPGADVPCASSSSPLLLTAAAAASTFAWCQRDIIGVAAESERPAMTLTSPPQLPGLSPPPPPSLLILGFPSSSVAVAVFAALLVPGRAPAPGPAPPLIPGDEKLGAERCSSITSSASSTHAATSAACTSWRSHMRAVSAARIFLFRDGLTASSWSLSAPSCPPCSSTLAMLPPMSSDFAEMDMMRALRLFLRPGASAFVSLCELSSSTFRSVLTILSRFLTLYANLRMIVSRRIMSKGFCSSYTPSMVLA
mmetsp:Transcript_37973/g.94379  ORF Transcript_37973/g.94379 Transcript_37973/m.94379 type:complete len:361 (-) Transcript_37973:2502-3584(-)